MSTPIITPKPRATCKDCKHFDPHPNHPVLGMCHRWPPQIYSWTVHVKQPSGQIEEQGRNNTAWPVLSNDQWCGEFTLNLVRADLQ